MLALLAESRVQALQLLSLRLKEQLELVGTRTESELLQVSQLTWMCLTSTWKEMWKEKKTLVTIATWPMSAIHTRRRR